MKRRTFPAALLALLLAAGCAPITVNHDYDPETDFSSLKTFDWMPDPATVITSMPDVLAGSSLIEKRIKEAVDTQLAAKGLALVDSDPDFRIVHYLSVKEKLRDWGITYDGRAREIKEGTLVLDFVDPRSMEIIWRGVARGTLSSNPSPEKMKKNINEAVRKILEGFPPRSK